MAASAATPMARNPFREPTPNPLHEPPLSRPSATLSPPCGERGGRGVPIWFMVLLRDRKVVEASQQGNSTGAGTSSGRLASCGCDPDATGGIKSLLTNAAAEEGRSRSKNASSSSSRQSVTVSRLKKQ